MYRHAVLAIFQRNTNLKSQQLFGTCCDGLQENDFSLSQMLRPPETKLLLNVLHLFSARIIFF
jgi:hypothetical protein